MTAADPIALAHRAQRRASRPEASVWVAASAGTGKTKVLTDRVLRLLLRGTAPSRILCLTFTKAAAAEMAVRINRRLGEWAVMDNDDLVVALTDLTGTEPDAATVTAARRLFADVIDGPGGLQIDTLHAFCQSVLRRFPIEAGVAPHFEVLDERTTWEVLAEAKAQVLLDADDDERLGDAIAALTGVVHEDRFNDLIQALTRERGRLGDLVERHGGVESLIAHLYRRLGVPLAETESDVIRAACRDDAFDGPALRAAAAAMAAGAQSDRERGAILAAWLDNRDGRIESWDAYVGVFFTQAGTVRVRLVTKAVAERAPAAVTALAAEAGRLAEVEAARRSRRTGTATAALIRVGAVVLDRYDALKTERAALDYDDLILRTRDLLRDAAAVSWVMYKLDEGIDHILIDEAQDTNPEQWQIVRALAEDFYSGIGRDDIDLPRTVFAVGDAKQSIFSFQRADPAGFEAGRTHFERRVTESRQEWATVDLDVSFRSTSAVLDLVDAVFAQDPARDGVATPGLTVRHRPSRTGQAGRVELWPAPGQPDSPAIEAWEPPVDVQDEADPEQQAAALVADRIRSWIDDREQLPARGRAIRPGDVMILVRRRGRFMARVVRELKNRRVPVAGVDRMVLNDQLAVMDLAALGSFLLLPSDDLTLATVLKGPLIGFDEDQLYMLADGRGRESLWTTLAARRLSEPAFAAAHETLSNLRARADFVPPYELFAELLGAGRGRERLLARLGPEAADPIEEFLALALAFEQSHPPSLQGFLAWFGAGATEIKRELEQSGQDVVRVMTVHGAKGLQAPVVILPDSMQVPSARGVRLFWDDDLVLWPPRKADDEAIATRLRAAQDARARQEYRRLLYVAMTRAEDRLYVCGWPTRTTAPEGNWYDLVKTAFDASEAAEIAFEDGRALRRDSAQEAEPQPDQEPPEIETAAAPPAWLSRPPPPEARPPRPLVPSRPEAEEPAVESPIEGQGRRFHRSLVMHRLLELVPDVAPPGRPAACRGWLDREASDLGVDTREEIARETLAILDDPQFAALFGPGSRAEVAVTGVVSDRVVSGRIDRFVVTDDAVLIVDYKTNRAPPADVDWVPPVYLSQMAAYRALLQGVYLEKSIRCALLWTAGPVLMRLPQGLLDRHAT